MATAKVVNVKVRIKQSIGGHSEPMYGLAAFSFRPGDEVEIHPDLAAAWIANGIAVAA